MIAARRVYIAASAFGGAAAVCLVVGLLRRHSVGDSFRIEGSYLNRSDGYTAYAPIVSSDVFSPFHPLHAYLWIGAAIAFAIAALVLLLLARAARS